MSRQLDRLSDDTLHSDWCCWIERAHDEANNQASRQHMFRIMRSVWEQNPRVTESAGFFLQWAADNYVEASAIAFRRELDTQSNTENLFHLLVELRKRPSVISRARIHATWKAGGYEADQFIESFAFVRDPGGNPERDHIDPVSVETDIKSLDQQDHILEYVQRTFAHRTPTRPDAVAPTFREFHAATKAVEGIVEKYYRLLTYKVVIDFEPAPVRPVRGIHISLDSIPRRVR